MHTHHEFGRTLERASGPQAAGVRILGYLAIGALTFQVVHFIEHIAQLSHWLMSPAAPPWLTPWAETGRDLLVVDGTHGSGNELLHLLGNLILFAGLIALAFVSWGQRGTFDEARHLKPALMVQGFHLIEHVSLTATYLIFGSAIGLSTLFGTARGAFAVGVRVWAHFLLNLIATYYAVRAGKELLAPRRRRVVLDDGRTARL